MEYKIIKVRGIGQSALIIDDDGKKIERIEEASRFFFELLNSYAGQGWRILTVVTNGNELVYVMQRETVQVGPMETKTASVPTVSFDTDVNFAPPTPTRGIKAEKK